MRAIVQAFAEQGRLPEAVDALEPDGGQAGALLERQVILPRYALALAHDPLPLAATRTSPASFRIICGRYIAPVRMSGVVPHGWFTLYVARATS